MDAISIYKDEIEKLAEDMREDNPNARIPRNRYKEYDTAQEVLKRLGLYLGGGAGVGGAIGSGLGYRSGRTGRGAAIGALAGVSLASLIHDIHQGKRDNEARKLRYKDDPEASRKAFWWGPMAGDKVLQANKKASEYDGFEKLAFTGFNKIRARRKSIDVLQPVRCY